MNSDGQQPVSASSESTFSNPHSVRSSSRAPPSTIKTYINTAPPWARDEPPSPNEQEPNHSARHLPSPHRPSDAASLQSSAPDDPGPSRWWTFARHRPTDSGSIPLSPSSQRPTRRPRDGSRAMSIPWLTASVLRRSQEDGEMSPSSAHTAHATDLDGSDNGAQTRLSNRSRLRIDMPPTNAPFTLSQTRTPGWDTPWTSAHPNGAGSTVPSIQDQGSHHDESEKLTPWQRRRKRLRAYMMYNLYVPLLFRMCNIVLTTAALAIAIKIRLIESRNGVMGALGSSPTLVIIFGSLTLVHVMIAIYLEYFGRPLGLWHTSWKLAYTLFEVVFICTWAAALALSFDNFFTSLIPCASPSSTSWYSKLPQPSLPNGINGFEGGVGDTLCDDQLALICLVGVGLLMYCFNLFIALFRIFEKVKYHPAALVTA
ncbi:hypothetical protein K466DRAFT_17870 [Polyporus arcularius HHB13444]|uniref:MARVEL domain-containing protein n=1 Tax=Polyporus arcularius HHB13444 TaxID=1314778 RepID=A0A5C3PJW2_9APHY|nr:hypothetical protein K466DRAFT_17870 [Polyporus arcularius HHB13444]